MSLKNIQNRLAKKINLSSIFGVITRINANNIEISGLRPSIGDIVRIVSIDSDKNELGMVTGLNHNGANISPFGFVEGFKVGDRVYASDQGMSIPVGEALLGRVVDPFMNPKDDKGINK